MSETTSRTAAPRAGDVAAPNMQAETGREIWTEGVHVDTYATRELRPVEVTLLLRYRDAFAGRVLEIGCGAGRVSGYVADIAAQATGIDVSQAMVDYCQQRYPRGTFQLGDLRQLSGLPDSAFDVVFPSFNVIDVLDDEERGRAFDEIHRMLVPGGLAIISAHNRDAHVEGPFHARRSDPARFALDLLRMPRRVRNHRRLQPFEREEASYAIRNDSAHDFTLLHYYIGRDEGERQLVAHGFEPVEVLDLDGASVPSGSRASHCSELHYVVRRPA